ncbi:26335_t:CDS:2, partial [Dentiscutata erythropus]
IVRYRQCFRGSYVVDCFGVTRNPADPTDCYMFVMRLCEDNLYQYIDRVRGNILWGEIVEILREIIDASELSDIFHNNPISNLLNNTNNNRVIYDNGILLEGVYSNGLISSSINPWSLTFHKFLTLD